MQALCNTVAEFIEFPDWVLFGLADAVTPVFAPAVATTKAVVTAVLPQQTAVVESYISSTIHPVAQKLPLMDVYTVLFTCLAYFAVILALYPVGKVLGKMQLKGFGVVHNFFLFALSFYMWFGIIVTAVASGYSLWNNPMAPGANKWRLAKLIWVFYASKIPEFIDTVIMMLKQNYRQVSFLHLYHHGTIFVIWFWVTMEFPGGDAYFSAMLNSGIHVIMYGYYFGTSIFSGGPIRRFLNSIKFFITYGQMTQFSCNVVQSVYLLYIVKENHYPVHLVKLLLWYMLTLLLLFGNFLVKNKAAAKKQQQPRKSAAPADGDRAFSKSVDRKRD